MLDVSSMIEMSQKQIGEIVVCGPNVSIEYLNRPDANCYNKIIGKLRL